MTTYKSRIVSILLSALILISSHYSRADDARIISTNASVTELLFALGKDENLIAIDVTSQTPTNYRALANIGYHRNLSAEGLLSLNPSHIIGSDHMGPPPVISALLKTDIKLIQLVNSKNIGDVRSNIQNLAKTLNTTNKAGPLLKKLERQEQQLKNNRWSKKKVAFLLSMDPKKLRLGGLDTTANAFIEVLNAKNVVDFNNYQNVSAESILALDADIIIVAGRNQDLAIQELFEANPILKHTKANINNAIYSINSSSIIAGLSIAAIDEAIRLAQASSQVVKR
ncbi:MAG: ABC transporter substrate-binding protein [Pseudomonadales bacterium]|nr:ABC transporter substrate-binding protein [Pseudomonadales bacterium]